MHARKVVPILLVAGAAMMLMHHRHELAGECQEGEKRDLIGPHGAREKRVPPLFEKWHQRAHASEAQSPAI